MLLVFLLDICGDGKRQMLSHHEVDDWCWLGVLAGDAFCI